MVFMLWLRLTQLLRCSNDGFGLLIYHLVMILSHIVNFLFWLQLVLFTCLWNWLLVNYLLLTLDIASANITQSAHVSTVTGWWFRILIVNFKFGHLELVRFNLFGSEIENVLLFFWKLRRNFRWVLVFDWLVLDWKLFTAVVLILVLLTVHFHVMVSDLLVGTFLHHNWCWWQNFLFGAFLTFIINLSDKLVKIFI